MSVLPIRLYPDPVLREPCAEIAVFDDALRALARDMIETMIAAPGVGLAAPQVGVSRRLAVVDVSVGKRPSALHVLVNPRLIAGQGSQVDVEACLSVPGISEKVERPSWVRVAAQNLEGEAFELEAEELFARAICHELDHLDGIFFFDHLRGLKRDRVRRALKKLGTAPSEPGAASS